MKIFGLNPLDAGIVLAYFVVILWLGKRAHRVTRNTSDFYVAGRRLGRFYQFFLSLGQATSSDQAVAVAREVYRQGIGGMWIQYLVLFLTPFYWFTTAFYRRLRQVTLGDFYTERFRSRFLGAAFALFTLVMSIIGGGVGFMVAGKTVQALTPKPASLYTSAEKRSVEMFGEYQSLRQRLDQRLNPKERARYEELNDRFKKGELKSFISFIDPLAVYLVYGTIVAAYTMLGGFFAAAITDVIQGCLIAVFSIMLIPIGLSRIGGFAALHARVPDYMFSLFGSVTTSEYAWYTILAMVVANLVSITASAPMMQTSSSARNEYAARFGTISGMFFKRFLMIFWALAGLLAVGLFAGQLHDPDLIWGYMTLRLLFPGAVGLMLAGILAANMSSLAATSVTYSALFIRNLYQPFVSPKSDRHLLAVGRAVIALAMAGGIGVALFVGNLLDLFKYFISMPAVFGASIWLGFVWRRVTKWAVIIQATICFVIYAVVPNVFQSWDWARTRPAFLAETQPRSVMIRTGALAEDVAAGRAGVLGERISKPFEIEPSAIFYDKVVRVRPEDPGSPRIGMGRFQAEIWVLSWTGIDFARFSRAQLLAARFFFDALFPFVLLFLLSYLTRPVAKADLDRFFGKMHTAVQPTPAEDEQAVAAAMTHPEAFEKKKLWPGSSWEIMKPGRADYLGFGGTWVLVGVIILLLWIMVSLR